MEKLVGLFVGFVAFMVMIAIAPALIHDIIVITWASMPWWAQVAIIMLILLGVLVIGRVLWKFARWLMR